MIILVVEDDPQQASLIKAILEEEQYIVDQAFDGQEGLKKIEVRDYDMAIIDLDLPQIAGQELVRHMRDLALTTPVMVLTANDELGSKVELLDIGADDYLTKPFAVDELVARVRAILRRPAPVITNTFSMAGIEMKYGTHEATINGRQVKLTRNEFRLLDFLLRKAGRVCTRAMIEEHVWGYDHDRNSNIIEAVIYKLRKKLGPSHGKLIETVQNLGYRFKEVSAHEQPHAVPQ